MRPGSASICVLGDAHLDVVVTLSGPVAPDTDTPAVIWAGPGGQAANVAAWAVALGGASRLVAARGSDLAATLIAGELGSRGVELVGPLIDGHTGTVVSVSDGGTRRSMLTDRGVGPRLAATDIDPAWLDGCSWLHLPAYSLVAAPVSSAALAAAAAARDRSVRLSIDLSSVSALADYGVARFRDLLATLRPAVVFGNQAEADLVGDLPGSELIIKLGPAGVRAGGHSYPAEPAQAADPTGAGDAFAAGYLLDGTALGLRAAARAVATIGGMP